MARSAINIGLPNPAYVIELGNRDAILPGVYEIEQGALSSVASPSIANLTLSAAAAVIDQATLAQTIAALTLAATVTGTVTATLAETIADLTLAAAGQVIASATLGATIDPITSAATGAAVSSGDAVGAWWWAAYVRRHEAEREAARLKWRDEHAIEGDGWAELPMPIGRGELFHDPDEQDMAALAAASLWLLAA